MVHDIIKFTFIVPTCSSYKKDKPFYQLDAALYHWVECERFHVTFVQTRNGNRVKIICRLSTF